MSALKWKILFFSLALIVGGFVLTGARTTLAAGSCSFKCQAQQTEHTDACDDAPDCSFKCGDFCRKIGDTCDAASTQCQIQAAPKPAQTFTPPPGRYGLKDPLEGATIPKIIGGVIRYVMGFVGALFLLYFLYGGILWMTAGGDAKQVEKAKKTLSYAVLGVVVIILSYTLIGLLLDLSGQIGGV